jgi:hypothetical protein
MIAYLGWGRWYGNPTVYRFVDSGWQTGQRFA